MEPIDILKSFFGNLGFTDMAISFVIGALMFIWVWSVLWTTKDISNRTNSLALQIISILMVILLTPIIGLPIYFLIRPVRYKDEPTTWKQALILNTTVCPECGFENLKEFDFCINCGKKLKVQCRECKTTYPSDWNYCSKCGAPNLETD